MLIHRWFMAAAFAALAACAPLNRAPVEARNALQLGLRHYEEGRYLEAFRSLSDALDEGLPIKERVRAHKYVAFIYCVSNRISECREEFRKAFSADPDFQLAPAEAGHPIWGPVFRSLKNPPPAAPAK
jgi:Tfp pilus assembly protein PilF